MMADLDASTGSMYYATAAEGNDITCDDLFKRNMCIVQER